MASANWRSSPVCTSFQHASNVRSCHGTRSWLLPRANKNRSRPKPRTCDMQTNEPVTLTRDVDAAVIPIGTKVTLQKGEPAYIAQSLGGSYTVVVNGNMFRIEGKDA